MNVMEILFNNEDNQYTFTEDISDVRHRVSAIHTTQRSWNVKLIDMKDGGEEHLGSGSEKAKNNEGEAEVIASDENRVGISNSSSSRSVPLEPDSGQATNYERSTLPSLKRDTKPVQSFNKHKAIFHQERNPQRSGQSGFGSEEVKKEYLTEKKWMKKREGSIEGAACTQDMRKESLRAVSDSPKSNVVALKCSTMKDVALGEVVPRTSAQSFHFSSTKKVYTTCRVGITTKDPSQPAQRKVVTVQKPFMLSGEKQQQRTRMAVQQQRQQIFDIESRHIAFKARPMPDFSEPFPAPKY